MIDLNAIVNQAIAAAVQQAVDAALVEHKGIITRLEQRITDLEDLVTGSGFDTRIERLVEDAVGNHDFDRMISNAVESEIDGYDFREIVADLQDPSAVTETNEFRDAVRDVILEAFNR